jgi:Spy/CpxP family protein refolding chaperone
MKNHVKNLTVLSVLVVMIIAGGVCKSEAAGFRHGHDSAVTLLSSLNLSQQQQEQLTSLQSTYLPALKTLGKQLRAAKKQLDTDSMATPPVSATVVADASAVAGIKSQLEAQRSQLNSALDAVLTPQQLQQLTQQLTAQFNNSLNRRIHHLLLGYSWHLQKQ